MSKKLTFFKMVIYVFLSFGIIVGSFFLFSKLDSLLEGRLYYFCWIFSIIVSAFISGIFCYFVDSKYLKFFGIFGGICERELRRRK